MDYPFHKRDIALPKGFVRHQGTGFIVPDFSMRKDDSDDEELQKIGEELGVVEPKSEKPEVSHHDKLKEFFFHKEPPYQYGPKCECGVTSIGQGNHSSWCPRHGRDD